MQSSESNPHISDRYSPLETLIFQALRRYGEYAPGSVDGETILMMIEFANMVVEDIRRHPYWPTDQEIDYYESQHDIREIPDPIIVAGLLAQLSIQQQSQKTQTYLPLYYRQLNQILHTRFIGNAQPVAKLPDKTMNGYR